MTLARMVASSTVNRVRHRSCSSRGRCPLRCPAGEKDSGSRPVTARPGPHPWEPAVQRGRDLMCITACVFQESREVVLWRSEAPYGTVGLGDPPWTPRLVRSPLPHLSSWHLHPFSPPGSVPGSADVLLQGILLASAARAEPWCLLAL